MRVAVLTYDAPHQKTLDFLVRLVSEGFAISRLIAAPLVALPPRPSTLRVRPRRAQPPHTRDFAQALDIPYVVMPHDDAGPHLEDADVTVIAGARILKPHVIDAAGGRVINLHPARLPKVRGLDSLKWSIYLDVAPAITAHWIDHRVDLGRCIEIRDVPLERDDTLIEVALRLEEIQAAMLPSVLRAVEGTSPEDFPALEGGVIAPPLTEEQEGQIAARFEAWRDRYAATP